MRYARAVCFYLPVYVYNCISHVYGWNNGAARFSTIKYNFNNFSSQFNIFYRKKHREVPSSFFPFFSSLTSMVTSMAPPLIYPVTHEHVIQLYERMRTKAITNTGRERCSHKKRKWLRWASYRSQLLHCICDIIKTKLSQCW